MGIQSISPLTINSIHSLDQVSPNRKASGLEQVGESFGTILDSLNESQLSSDNLVQKLASGGDVDLHQVTIASEENDVNFRVAMAIRDKLVEAYREVMRMSV